MRHSWKTWPVLVSMVAAGLLAGPSCMEMPTQLTFTHFLNTDPNSQHWLSGGSSDGTSFDIFASAGQFASDMRITMSNGDQMVVQFDQLGRPSYAEGPDGSSMRIRSYFDNGTQDVTLTAPNGSTTRATVDFGVALGQLVEGKRAPAIGWTKLYDGEKGFDFRCEATRVWIEQLRDTEAISGLVSILTCLADAGFDLATFPSDYAIGVCAAGVEGGGIVEDAFIDAFNWINELRCDAVETCDSSGMQACPFTVEMPPVDPPETGDVVRGTGDVQVTLTWDTDSTDLDLHVVDPDGTRIFWNNATSPSGGMLDVDDTDGFGPENIFWPTDGAPSGLYTVEVVYYFDARVPAGPTNYTVRVTYPDGEGGQIMETFMGTAEMANSQALIPVTEFVVP